MADVRSIRGGDVVQKDDHVIVVEQDVVDGLEFLLAEAKAGRINGLIAIGILSHGKFHCDTPKTMMAGTTGIADNLLVYMGVLEMLRRDLGKMSWDAENERES